eukprot:CAMPEP_0171149170 /NCGR_PEP_ID=MMETSP0766_2-20121228/148931_1 /TAXON_ID=439317 /ORGANISM="Gambierdiscus australes, Strain CAWD 149" /LENGTH=556 /DNA_ID=CAMNT_0011613081 /DNA_START=14 /DNA_END=1681 /DNA_ORIENTATION=+
MPEEPGLPPVTSNRSWTVVHSLASAVASVVLLGAGAATWRCSETTQPASSSLESINLQARPPSCPCDWIGKDDCLNTDPCACFCRSVRPEGPCAACGTVSLLKMEHDVLGQRLEGSWHPGSVSAPAAAVTPVSSAATDSGSVAGGGHLAPASGSAKGPVPQKAKEEPFIGVNLGGWLVLEDWMWGPEMLDREIPDEWTLVKINGGPKDPRAISKLTSHWESFVSEVDLDRLHSFGVTHVRIPLGFWLLDYDVTDGFVNGGRHYLTRLLVWLRLRGMRALLDLHALPCAQASGQSFTGRTSKMPWFFSYKECYDRGKRVMRELAKLILSYEEDARTTGVVMGMSPINEPDWSYWDTSPGVKELYTTIVPELRRLLPARRYTLHLCLQGLSVSEGARWLKSMRQIDPDNFAHVTYDIHVYHSYGDDNGPGRHWTEHVDACKTCCRDSKILAPLVAANLSVSIGEYSLNTGFPGNPDFWSEYLRVQLSLWRNTAGVVGSFFWNHRVLIGKRGYFKEMSLLHLIPPEGPLLPVSRLNTVGLCSGYDLSKCPPYDSRHLRW